MKKEDILARLQAGEISVEAASALLMKAAPKRGDVVRRERTPAADLSKQLSDAARRILELHSGLGAKNPDDLPTVLGKSPASNVEEIRNEILAFCDLGSIADVTTAARDFRSAIAIQCTRRYLDGLRPPATPPLNDPPKAKPKPRIVRKPPPVVAPPTPLPQAKEYSETQLAKIIDCLKKNNAAGITLLSFKTGIAERELVKSIIPALIRDNVICEVTTEKGARYKLLSK